MGKKDIHYIFAFVPFILVSLVACIVSWLTFTINALYDEPDRVIISHCGSLLWRYLLSMCFLIFIERPYASSECREVLDYPKSICAYVLTLATASWGIYETWFRPCANELAHYHVYTMSKLIIEYHLVMIVSFPTIVTLCISCSTKKPLESDENICEV